VKGQKLHADGGVRTAGACTQADSGRVLGKIPSDKEVAESEALVAEIMSLQVRAVPFI
jgi:hypothetical protein